MKRFVLIILLVLYVVVWGMQKEKTEWDDYYLSPPFPAPILKVATGYASQMAAFSLFVKVSIFVGGPLRGVDKMSYAESMAQNFDVMSALYPEFIDTYHYTQSFLAPISPLYAKRTNEILGRGISVYPDILYLKFFQAFNYYYYMNEPEKSADMFFAMSKRPDAPPWFGQLAAILMGRGGNLIAGKTMLQAMLETEQDKTMKNRYRRVIRNFDEALKVQAALNRFREQNKKDAVTLQVLIPHYLSALPQFDLGYKLIWNPPVLQLEKP